MRFIDYSVVAITFDDEPPCMCERNAAASQLRSKLLVPFTWRSTLKEREKGRGEGIFGVAKAWNSLSSIVSLVGGVAQWLGCRCVAGGLSLIYAW